MGYQDTLPRVNPPPYTYSEAYAKGKPRAKRRCQQAAVGLVFLISVLLISLPRLTEPSPDTRSSQSVFENGLQRCELFKPLTAPTPDKLRSNPRWNAANGQQKPLLLRNATLFDGQTILEYQADVHFDRGVVKAITRTTDQVLLDSDEREVVDLNGQYVTPGLVDMHSHHGLWPFHSLSGNRDVNETPLLGPITPFVRSIDGFKPYDPAIQIIAGGGVTTSLILPGSSNVIGGQAYVVKNAILPGENEEPVVEELLLDDGIPEAERQRYMKMACGENPKHTYHHTRMGNVWLLREHFSKAKELLDKQDAWCQAASSISQKYLNIQAKHEFVREAGALPDTLEYEPTISLLRGHFNINIHCYEPEDLERMLAVLHEFGVHPRAFHHALEAFQVPELLKQQERNITIATFAENAFFKAEAYGASLRAGAILAEHDVAVAYKSDHTGEGNNAQYLLHQAAVGHSFGLPLLKALQSVTSVPARSIQQDHRIGFIRPGYDADIAVWDSHPLTIGATALQVYIDGKPTLNKKNVADIVSKSGLITQKGPEQRPVENSVDKEELRSRIHAENSTLVFTGISQNYLSSHPTPATSESTNLTLVLQNNKIHCLGDYSDCALSAADGHVIALKDGQLTPGLIAVSQTLGLVEITGEPSTFDGVVDPKTHILDEDSLDYAKYGVKLDGRALGRARLGGVTRAIAAPFSRGGLVKGVSTGFWTSGRRSVLEGGIWKDDVALHVQLGEGSKVGEISTISGAVGKLREIFAHNGRGDGIYAKAQKGEIPVVVHVVNTDEIRQLILLKRSYPDAKIVIFGGHGAPHVASALAAAEIPVILTANRGVPDTWEKRDALTGPPLTFSPARILSEAGVLFALAIGTGDSHVHGLASEAGWAAKYAGLSGKEAVELVAGNVEKILGLEPEEDFVIWDGDPLKGEGSVVVSVEGDGVIGTVWPDES